MPRDVFAYAGTQTSLLRIPQSPNLNTMKKRVNYSVVHGENMSIIIHKSEVATGFTGALGIEVSPPPTVDLDLIRHQLPTARAGVRTVDLTRSQNVLVNGTKYTEIISPKQIPGLGCSLED